MRETQKAPVLNALFGQMPQITRAGGCSGPADQFDAGAVIRGLDAGQARKSGRTWCGKVRSDTTAVSTIRRRA
jgi:hypothetical protein